jgi:hypothetical protein
MRALLLFVLLLVATTFALADEIDSDTMAAVVALAARDYADPAAAEIRNVRKSLARNNQGYCGEITIEDGDGFTVFHAIIESGTGPSVLRLADYADDPAYGETVQRLMRNFGCME